jgi:hypothetical protein
MRRGSVDRGPAMDDAVADAADLAAREPGGEGSEDRAERRAVVGGRHLARRAVEDEARRRSRLGPEAVDLPEQDLARLGRRVVEAELERGGPGVERQDDGAHGTRPASTPRSWA